MVPGENLLSPDSMVDHFKVVRLVGRGGMGEVYLARDTMLGRRVALKMIRSETMDSEAATARFLHEARVTASLSHPNVVSVYAVGQHDGHPYLALEYLEGETLRQRLEQERPGVRESMRIGMTVARALAEAHENRILHRDLKPENVLMPKDGRLRVLDFGLAKVMRASWRVLSSEEACAVAEVPTVVDLCTTDARTLYGTPAYVPPERWLGEESTAAADVWALGIMLHELVGGRRPYRETSLDALRHQVVDVEPVPPLLGSQDVPGELPELIARCLEKNPAGRPSACEVAEQLEAMLTQTKRQRSGEHSPFRGLFPFAERHSDFFFGRDAEIAAFLESMRDQPVLPVVGPSGAGKSSFVQAGVVPRLREQGSWKVLQLRPGTAPFSSMAALFTSGAVAQSQGIESQILTADLGPSSRSWDEYDVTSVKLRTIDAGSLAADETPLEQQLRASPRLLNVRLHQLAELENCKILLLVDQLEELYTMVASDDVRQSFMAAICSAADDASSPVRVVVTIRDDFLGRVAEGGEVRAAFCRVTVLRSPGLEALREILERPLEAVGYSYEDPDLVEEMISSVREEPACLPLLQFASQMLWDRRDRNKRLLCRTAYEAMGGVAGALAEHADGVLGGLSPSQVRLARDLFLRLVTAEGTRKAVSTAAALDGLGPAAAEVLTRLTLARLITTRKSHGEEKGEAMLELVHESLIRSWGRLARWIDESREELSFLAEIGQAAELWQRRGRREEELWQGRALFEAERMLESCAVRVSELVVEFLAAAARRERRKQRRKQLVVSAVIAALAAVALFFVLKEHETRVQKIRAETEWRRAEAQRAEAQRQGARAAMLRADFLEARAQLRGSLETQDSLRGRALWWGLDREPQVWSRDASGAVNAVTFSPDGHTLAAACHDSSVYLLDVKTAIPRVLRGVPGIMMSVAFSPDERSVAAGSFFGDVMVWDLGTGQQRVFKGHGARVYPVVYSPDGSLLASGSLDRTVRLWDTSSGASTVVMSGHTGLVSSVSFSPDGKLLASGSKDATVRIWEVATGSFVRALAGHTDVIRSTAFSTDGRLLATASDDRTVRLWDVATGRQQRIVSRWARQVGPSPDGRMLASMPTASAVEVWDVDSGIGEHVTVGTTKDVRGWDFDGSGGFLATGSEDWKIRLWRTTTAIPRRAPAGHASAIQSAVFSPDGSMLASTSDDLTVRLWDATTGAEKLVLAGHGASVAQVAFDPDGKLLASASLDNTVRVWSASTGALQAVLSRHSGRVYSVRFSPDGKTLASASDDRTVRLWDVATGVERRVLAGHDSTAWTAEFSPDGKLLASVGDDRTVRLWEVSSGREWKVLAGHVAPVRGVAFHPAGNALASGSVDGIIRIWDLRGNSRVLRHPGAVIFVTFSPDGKHLIASGEAARLWDYATGKESDLPGGLALGIHHRYSPDGKSVVAAAASNGATVVPGDAITGMPKWRGPVLLSSAVEIYTHLGWRRLESEPPAAPVEDRSPAWRQAVEERAVLGSESEDGSLLCLQTSNSRIELWDLDSDRLLFGRSLAGIEQVVAVPGGCAVRTNGEALLFGRSGETRVLGIATGAATVNAGADASTAGTAGTAATVNAIAWDRGEILAVTDSRVGVFDTAGTRIDSLSVGPGVTSIARLGEWWIVGFREGQLELLRVRPGREKPRFSFEGVPASKVSRILEGPTGTLIAGYENGVLGIWDPRNGAQLESIKMHGSVEHLVMKHGRLYAATAVGDSVVLDLTVFEESYCSLLGRVWQSVPVLWEGGLPVVRPVPDTHRCR
ncbi:MAG: protein kinase [Pseudomonadota bacterium]